MRDATRPVGLDGVPRVSPGGRFGLLVAISGDWESDSTFTLDYEEIAPWKAARPRPRNERQ